VFEDQLISGLLFNFVDSNIAISRQKPAKRKIYMWKKADTQKLKSKIEEMSNNILEKFTINTNINTLWDYFKTKCTDIMEECIPSKMLIYELYASLHFFWASFFIALYEFQSLVLWVGFA
jgi:hypothetical protein